jgi:hypothetical protein
MQVAHPMQYHADVSLILMLLEVTPGKVVLEAGS